ncbi:MAG: hypothetical protein HQM16_06575 [Deltaproteobacteria bacterium]|nr:hypothetical protein [Deltaproteobacteria bacterium]
MYSKKSIQIIFALLILLGSVAVSSLATAESLVQRHTPRMMQGTRPLGMGNAFIAVKGTDENAMFYNPAAINDYEKKFHFQFLLPTIEFSYKSINFFAQDIPNLAEDIDAANGNAAKINVLDAFAAANTGRYEEVGLQGNVAVMMHKYITAALFYDTQGVIALLNAASSTVDMEVETNAGLMVGSAYSFFDDMLQAGLAVKFIGRHLMDETVTQRDIIATAEFGDILSLTEFGFGVGFDVGVKGAPPIHGKVWDYLKPQFALTLQDIGHTRFFAGQPVGRQKQSFNFGTAIHPDFWRFKSIFAIDIREIDSRTDFLNKFHAGYELTWPEISKILRSVSVRVGASQAYPTAGVGFDFKYFKLNFATYGREIASRTIQKQSRMLNVQLAAGF